VGLHTEHVKVRLVSDIGMRLYEVAASRGGKRADEERCAMYLSGAAMRVQGEVLDGSLPLEATGVPVHGIVYYVPNDSDGSSKSHAGAGAASDGRQVGFGNSAMG